MCSMSIYVIHTMSANNFMSGHVMRVTGIHLASVSTSFRLDVGIVPTVWYFVFNFNLYLYEFPDNVHIYCVYTTVSCRVKLKTIQLVCVASRKSEDK